MRSTSKRSPRPATTDAGSASRAESAAYTPCGPSSTEPGPLAPASASLAARTPFSDADPGCSCLVDDPVERNSSRPPPAEPAMPSASRVVAASSPASRAATTADESAPAIAVACRPRAWKPCGLAAATRQTVSYPATAAASTSAPVAPRSSPTAKAAGSTTAVAWTRPPAWVSSKSRPWTRAPVPKAAAAEPIASRSPSTGACAEQPAGHRDGRVDHAGPAGGQRGAHPVEQVTQRGPAGGGGHVGEPQARGPGGQPGTHRGGLPDRGGVRHGHVRLSPARRRWAGTAWCRRRRRPGPRRARRSWRRRSRAGRARRSRSPRCAAARDATARAWVRR